MIKLGESFQTALNTIKKFGYPEQEISFSIDLLIFSSNFFTYFFIGF